MITRHFGCDPGVFTGRLGYGRAAGAEAVVRKREFLTTRIQSDGTCAGL